MKLDNWWVYRDPYQAPEVPIMSLKGHVYGHPKHKDGNLIRTSDIVSTEGRYVTTKSGSVYELGEPALEYVQWLKDNGLKPIDPIQPVKFIDRTVN